MDTNKETIKVLHVSTLNALVIKIYNILFNQNGTIDEDCKELSEFLHDRELINPTQRGWELKFNEADTIGIFRDNEELTFTYKDSTLPGWVFLEQTIRLRSYICTKADWSSKELVQMVNQEIHAWLKKCFVYGGYNITGEE